MRRAIDVAIALAVLIVIVTGWHFGPWLLGADDE